MRLHFTETISTHTIIFQAPGGSRFPYYGSGDNTYTRYPGVTAEMVRTDGASPSDTRYVITTFNQYEFTFDADGNFIKQEDPSGNTLTLTYVSDKLDKVSQGSRYLEFTYNGADRVETVEDNFGRTITMTYDVNDNLTSIANPLNQTTTFNYKTSTNLLDEIVDASGRTVKEIFYDSEDRAYAVRDGEGNLLAYINYNVGGSSFGGGSGFAADDDLSATRLITVSGVVMTYTYDSRGTIVDVTQACTEDVAGCQANSGSAYDYNFKHNEVVDENGNPTVMNWSTGGSNLEGTTDALGNSTSLTYDNLNNLTQVVNARGFTTTYAYDDANFPSFRTRMTDTLGNVTIYTATISATDGISGYLKAQKDPDGVVTTYDYNEFGQITRTVRAVGTPDAVTTTYGYDAIGRLITTTQTSVLVSHTSLNVYDDADRLKATIANWTGTDPAQWLTDCDTSSGARDTNVCTRYKYDDAGRTISTTNALSQTTLTFYDDAGQVVTSVTNYDGTTPTGQLCTDFTDPDPEYNICSLTGYDEFGRVVTTTNSLGHQSVTEYNVMGRVSRTIQNYVDGVFDPSDPDADIQTLYEYDDAGNTIIVTDTLTRTTRTFYDALNRVVGTVSNWRGETVSTITNTESLPNCLTLPENRDYDICTLYQYDEMGNTIIVTDTLGRMTRTFYDELNRVEASVANWNPDTLSSPADCNISPNNVDSENICTLYGYENGRQISVTNALSQTSHTVYDEAGRAVIQVTNWNGATISADGTGCANTATNPTAVENLCTDTSFDQLGRRKAYTDTMGLLTTFEYDGLSRLVTTTRFLDGQPVTTTTSYDALGNRLTQVNARGFTTTFTYDSLNRVIVTTSPEGVAITQAYNAAGWVITTTDNLGHSMVNEYDDLGRLISSTDAELNKTQYAYDGLGNQVSIIDAENVTTTYTYDGLNRLVEVIENYVDGTQNGNEEDLTTKYLYDAIGNRVVVTNANNISFTQTSYDALNRPVVITNAVGNETNYKYDALGSRVVMTDGNMAVTLYTYDALNRLILTNYLSDTEAVTYTYDAAGNRLVMTDSIGVTTYEYDGFYRLISVTNPFDDNVQYSYDLVGNRINLTYPDSKVVTYTYDMDDRLEQVEDWDGGLTTYEYDPAGRLVTTTLPNGVVTVNSYDDANRLTSLEHEDAYGLLVANYVYELDKVGNRVVTTETMRVVSPALTLTLGTQFTTTVFTDDQQLVDVAYNPTDDEYFAVWRDKRNGAAADIYGRLLDADGATLGSPIALVTAENFQGDPHVAYSPAADRYLLVWAHSGGGDSDVYGRLLDGDGQLISDTLAIDDNSSHDSQHPDVVYDADSGNFLVTWSRGVGSGASILARLVETNAGLGSIFIVSESTGSGPVKDTPAISSAGNGSFLIVWQDKEGSDANILGQRVSRTTTVGSVITVTDASDNQDEPALAYHAGSDKYLVVWTDQVTSTRRIMARFVEGDGDMPDPAFVFDEPESNPDRVPEVLALTNGFLVAIHWEAATRDVRIGTVTLNGVPENVQYLSEAPGSQLRVALAGEGDTGLALWETNEGSDFDIVGKQVTMTLNVQTTVINYTYDPIYRLTNAAHTGAISATYSYLYDVVGNRTAYTRTITSTQVTTYTYNNANQLVTAKLNTSADKWYYEFDGNGNQIRQVPNGLTPADGEVRYTFNQRNLLIRIENHDGSDYQVQAEVTYDGSGQRLQLVAYVVATPVTATFTIDVLKNAPLVVENGLNDMVMLYGLFGLGEYGTEWQYYIGDGQLSVRQLVDDNGRLTLSRTYEPFGRILQMQGGEESLYGFIGSLSGGGGLLFSNGWYYDPATGRLLSPDYNFDPKHPSRTLNPYIVNFLVNPMGLLMPPLLFMYWRRRRGKKGMPPGLWFLVLGIMVAFACDSTPTPIPPEEIPSPTPGEVEDPTATASSTPGAPTPNSTNTSTPSSTPSRQPSATPTVPDCPTPTPTSTPIPTQDLDRWQITSQDLAPFNFSWDDYFLTNPQETEAIVLARFGVGEGEENNPRDQDLVMWTIRVRKEIGLAKLGGPPTINRVVTNGGAYEVLQVLRGDRGGEPYKAPELIVADNPTKCLENVTRMVYPCNNEYLQDLNRAYEKAVQILNSDINSMPPELRYYESFVGKDSGAPGTFCLWGDTDTTRLRPSEQLAGATYFMDCVLDDNRDIWGQE